MQAHQKPSIEEFQNLIWAYYKSHKRHFAWRENQTPYKVVVSEIMLQQTQTSRVEGKFDSWLSRFPSFEALAQASLRDVLEEWSGLGYNRRGLALQTIAQIVIKQYHGTLPQDPNALETLPGIGKASARSIAAFAFNAPTVFIETNIRSVFIHFFFQDQEKISDKELMPLVELSLDKNNPREWYYALMDYGVMLKKKHSNPNKKSTHYTKQSKFEGSNRQMRSLILKTILEHKALSIKNLSEMLGHEYDAVESNCLAMKKEGLLCKQGDLFSIK